MLKGLQIITAFLFKNLNILMNKHKNLAIKINYKNGSLEILVAKFFPRILSNFFTNSFFVQMLPYIFLSSLSLLSVVLSLRVIIICCLLSSHNISLSWTDDRYHHLVHACTIYALWDCESLVITY